MTATRAPEPPRLALARRIVAGEVELPGLSAARAVCVLARQELEVVVDALLADRGLTGCGATMRIRLICLRHAYHDRPQVGATAAEAWWRLSAACHHHAYELGPTLGEALDLLDDVADLFRSREARRLTTLAHQGV